MRWPYMFIFVFQKIFNLFSIFHKRKMWDKVWNSSKPKSEWWWKALIWNSPIALSLNITHHTLIIFISSETDGFSIHQIPHSFLLLCVNAVTHFLAFPNWKICFIFHMRLSENWGGRIHSHFFSAPTWSFAVQLIFFFISLSHFKAKMKLSC